LAAGKRSTADERGSGTADTVGTIIKAPPVNQSGVGAVGNQNGNGGKGHRHFGRKKNGIHG
jgi:hypothetical protein